MNAGTHARIHHTDGAQLQSGGGLSDMSVDGDASLDAHCQFQNDESIIRDEDIKITQAARTKTTNLTKWYRLGS